MFNTITYTLEDHATGYVPEAQPPVICDHCERMLNGHGRYWKSFHALKSSHYRFEVVDYRCSSTQECVCCHTHDLMGRHQVELIRKAA